MNTKNLFLTSVGKFILFFSVAFLFSVGCSGSFGGDEEEDIVEIQSTKIQKNSAFQPSCTGQNNVLKCDKGVPACGTELGSGELKVYCIDSMDKILEEKASCEKEEVGSQPTDSLDSFSGRPICKQLARSS